MIPSELTSSVIGAPLINYNAAATPLCLTNFVKHPAGLGRQIDQPQGMSRRLFLLFFLVLEVAYPWPSISWRSPSPKSVSPWKPSFCSNDGTNVWPRTRWPIYKLRTRAIQHRCPPPKWARSSRRMRPRRILRYGRSRSSSSGSRLPEEMEHQWFPSSFVSILSFKNRYMVSH